MAYAVVNLNGCESFLALGLTMREFQQTNVGSVWFLDFGPGNHVDVTMTKARVEEAIAASTEKVTADGEPLKILSIHESDAKPHEDAHIFASTDIHLRQNGNEPRFHHQRRGP